MICTRYDIISRYSKWNDSSQRLKRLSYHPKYELNFNINFNEVTLEDCFKQETKKNNNSYEYLNYSYFLKKDVHRHA